jgi:predicted TIM-barrel fold metal-dependent hydrolase
MRTLYRLVSMPSIGSRTTVVGVPAGVSSGAMVMPHPMPTRPMAVPTSFTVAPTLGWKPAAMHMLRTRRPSEVAGHITHDLFARANWPTAELIAYIRRMAARATPRGWHLQFYTPGTIVRDLLPFLADLQDTFVIDHLGYMTEPDQDFERRLLAVLSQGSCWVKLSGAYRVAKDKPLSSVTPWGRALVAARPDRHIWGSDWPHLPDGQRDTGEILNLLADWAPTQEARQAILVDGPARLFFS